jgi:alkylation response protein AidB-like acyl-CoA dehydrogenase
MDLRWSAEEQAFRTELRAWLADVLPSVGPKPDPQDWPARRAWDTAWQRMLYDAGYAGIHWPKEFGGRGASATEHLIYVEETERAKAPYVGTNFVGLLHAGPTIINEGTDAQRARYLPPILRGDEVWAQGFSEPDAGSDLASLRTRAVRDGDHYVVTGRKVWTSHATVADHAELLVRTDPDAPKHRGISWLILPMDAPGVEIRPLRSVMDTDEFSELILDEVRIPVDNRVGAENDGWRVTMTTLSFERGSAFIADVITTGVLVDQLAEIARKVTRNGASAWDDRGLRTEIGHLKAELEGLWAMCLRNVSEANRTGLVGVGGSIFKLRYTEARQKLGELTARVIDRAALSMHDIAGRPTGFLVEDRLHSLSITIAAGTSQIQRSILAERALGLPKDKR